LKILTLESEYVIGDQIGSYKILREIAQGATSQVFEATEDGSNLKVALKIVHQDNNNTSYNERHYRNKSTDLNNIRSEYISAAPPSAVDIHASSHVVSPDPFAETFLLGRLPPRSSLPTENSSSMPVTCPIDDTLYQKPNETFSATLDIETTLWSRLDHPHILEMKEVIKLPDYTVIVSELASGGTLLDHIKATGKPGINEFHCQKLFFQLVSAIKYLHQTAGLIHRDIKCENVLLDRNRNVKLCDFGLACETVIHRIDKVEPFYNIRRQSSAVDFHPADCSGLCCSSPVTESNLNNITNVQMNFPVISNTNIAGSLHYTAPELLVKREGSRTSGLFCPFCPATDIWSLGVVLYAMCTGTLPFNDTFLPRLQLSILNGRYNLEKLGHMSNGALEIINGILEVDPRKRWDLQRIEDHPWTRGGEC
jgi:serine/threonine protein kinase